MIGNVYRNKQSNKRCVVVEVANEHAKDHKLQPILIVYVDDDRKTWAVTRAEFYINFVLAF